MPAPMYRLVATPFRMTPDASNSQRTTVASTSGSTEEKTSTPTPTSTALAIVPRPGRSRSGIQSVSTTKLVATMTVPSDRPVTSPTP